MLWPDKCKQQPGGKEKRPVARLDPCDPAAHELLALVWPGPTASGVNHNVAADHKEDVNAGKSECFDQPEQLVGQG